MFQQILLAPFSSYRLAGHTFRRHFPILQAVCVCLSFTLGGTLHMATVLFGCFQNSPFGLRF
jgi:hypothetical protein